MSFLKTHHPPALLRARAAFTLVEVMVATALGGAAVAGTMMVSATQFLIIKSTRETNAASLCLDERIEQLRIANWRQITDATYLTGTYFATKPKSCAPLGSYTERLTISAWPDPTVAGKLVVEKTPGNLAQVISAATDLSSKTVAKVEFALSWNGGRRARTRSFSTVISDQGLSRQNLPATGAGYTGNGGSSW